MPWRFLGNLIYFLWKAKLLLAFFVEVRGSVKNNWELIHISYVGWHTLVNLAHACNELSCVRIWKILLYYTILLFQHLANISMLIAYNNIYRVVRTIQTVIKELYRRTAQCNKWFQKLLRDIVPYKLLISPCYFDVELVNIRDNYVTWLFLLSSEA